MYHRLSPRALIPCAVVGIAALAACDRTTGGKGTVEGDSTVAYTDTLQCPNHDVGRGGDTLLPIAGAITLIAEYHDCQRLVDTKRNYITLAGVWVSEVLAALPDSLHVLNPWLDSLEHADTAGGAAGTSQAVGTGLTFALVRAWTGDYEPLGIKQGWNCLRVFPTNHPSTDPYEARMEPISRPEECVEASPVTAVAGKTLFVHPHQMPGLSEGDYPPVGRWEWDSRRKEHYISLKCGGAWCDITPDSNYHASPDYHAPAGTKRKLQRVVEVKGWYDEQDLAIPNPAQPGKLMPANVHGTVYPDSGLDDIESTDAFAGKWVTVARIGLKGPLPLYERKLNTDMGEYPSSNGMGRLNQLTLCAKGTGDCEGVPDTLSCTPDPKGITWYARMDPSGTKNPKGPPGPSGPAYFCVTRHDHSGLGRHIPGTARWWWVNTDEKLWIKCAAGCCTVN